MYTRLTARGCHDEIDWCTRTAISALASEVSATSPSIPGVFGQHCAASPAARYLLTELNNEFQHFRDEY